MGMIDRFLGAGATVTAVGNAASGMAQILTPSATRRMELDEEAYARAIAEHQAEFAGAGTHWFDALMNGLNRLPRPLLTLGTIGLFVYAMVEPVGFSARMQGLALVPDGTESSMIFKTNFPPLARVFMPEGRGVLVRKGKAEIVQIARPEMAVQ